MSEFPAQTIRGESTLAALSRAEASWARQLAGTAWRFDCGSVLLALLASIFSSPPVVVTLAVLSILSMVVGRILTYMRRTRYEAAERARRALLVVEGHSIQLDPAERAQLEAEFSSTARRRASTEKTASEHGIGRPGVKRLRILIQKDAFWTANLCRATARMYYPLVYVYPVLLCFLLVVLFTSTVANQAVLFGRIAVFGASCWLGSEGLSAYLAFRRAAEQAESIDKALEGKPAGTALEAVLPALRDFDVIVAGLPSIPEPVNAREWKRLQKIWQNRVLGYRL